MTILFHICPRDAWNTAQTCGEYRADSLTAEGFIHCSMPEQVIGTANLWFRGQTDLLLLTIDADKLLAPLRYDDVGNGRVFPHLYGPLNRDAVVHVQDFPAAADGTFHGDFEK